MENSEKFKRAKKRAEAKLGFYTHLAVFVLVNILLIVINYAGSSEYIWFKWPLFGWGIAIVIHGAKVFLFPGDNSELIDKMTEREMNKEL